MRLIPRSLFGRLVLALVGYGAAVVLAFAVIAELTHSRFHLRATQSQAFGWAGEIVARHPDLAALTITGERGRAAVEATLKRIGESNPGAALYLVGRNGDILAASVPGSRIVASWLDAESIEALVDGSAMLPLMISDPLDPAVPRIFSAARVGSGSLASSYLVMLLLGPDTRGFLATHTDFLLSDSLAMAVGVTLPALATAVVLLFIIVRPVRRITKTLSNLEREELGLTSDDGAAGAVLSELDQVSEDVEVMARKIGDLLKKLREDDKTLRELFAGLSHDLRTPLTVLEDCIERLTSRDERSPISADESSELIDVVAVQVRSLSRMIASQFELASLQRAEYRIRSEPFFIADLVNDVAMKFSARAIARGLKLEVLGKSARSLVYADVMLIERVLDNLISNAVRHAKGATCIRIEIVDGATSVKVAVCDDGPGLPREWRERLACSAQSVPDWRMESARHVGLGLGIVRRILELHGSCLVLEETGERGTRLGFSLRRV